MKTGAFAILLGVATAFAFVAMLYYRAPVIDDALSSSHHPFAAVARNSLASVVRITSLKTIDSKREDKADPDSGKKTLDFFERHIPGKYTVDNSGSGIALDRRGYIVTNFHIISGAQRVLARPFGAGRDMEAVIIGKDPMTDLALLKVADGRSFTPAVFTDTPDIKIGQLVASIGFPYQMEGTLTFGFVNGIEKGMSMFPALDEMIQTAAAVHPGNDGSPLFDERGRVIGINTAFLNEGGGFGLSIPSGQAKKVIADLLSFGKVRRGWMGITMQGLTRELSDIFQLTETRGALVTSTDVGSSAVKSGMRVGDVITTFDGTGVENPRELLRLVMKKTPGEKATVEIMRSGVAKTLEIRIDQM